MQLEAFVIPFLQCRSNLILNLIFCGLFLTCCNCELIQIVTSTEAESTGSHMLLDQGLMALQSNTVLQLHPGTHTLHRFTFVHDLTNVSIQGVQSASQTVIQCAEGIGLAFFNISNFQIQNVTITTCGLNQDRWGAINQTVHETFDVVVEIPAIVKVAIFLAACEDVSLEHFQVSNTSGIGLLAVSLLGTTYLSDAEFEGNTPSFCPQTLDNFHNFDYHKWIGGGAYFLYQDYRDTQISMRQNLTITDSQFSGNQDCSIVVLLEGYIEEFAGLVSLDYEIGAGGGLTVMMAQLQYSVDVSVTNSTFVNNSARSGAGAHVGLFSGVPDTDVLFDGCTFRDNGEYITTISGGVVIHLVLLRLRGLPKEHIVVNSSDIARIQVSNSTFSTNMGAVGGGLSIISHTAGQQVHRKYQVWVDNCRFTYNRALGGSGLLIHERNIGLGNFDTYISDCSFEGNSAEIDRIVQVGNVQEYGSVHIRSVNVTLYGNVTFLRNMVTALAAEASLIHVAGNVTFYQNRASIGAGLQLRAYSNLILKRGSNIVFQENRAITGGAVYVQFLPINSLFIQDDCFLFFEQPQFAFCVPEETCTSENLNISIVFDGNDARIGSMIHGSALETCPWVKELKRTGEYNENHTVYENFYYNSHFNHTFFFTQAPTSAKQVGTAISKLAIEQYSFSVMPGEQFALDVSALDALGQHVPGVITSVVFANDNQDDNPLSIIGDFGHLELNGLKPHKAPITVFGKADQYVTIKLVTVDQESEREEYLEVFLMPCARGFTHNLSSCLCDDQLQSRGVSCDVASNLFTVPARRWLGPIKDNITSNDDLTVVRCVLNYCKEGDKEVVSEQWDSQCADGFHRSGQLCGKCEDGYSIQLGSYRCAKCTNWYLFLLVFFIIAGFFLVFLMGKLHISVAEGFLSATLLFSNIITMYTVFFRKRDTLRGLNFLAAFLSLNFGFESCFYDGMDAQALVALQLGFVVYVNILSSLGKYMDDHYSKPSIIRYFHQKYSPSKALATLTILCYVSLLQASIGILSFTIIKSLDGDVRIVWYVDPTVPYFRGFHAFLGVVALLLLFLHILPFPFFLTFCSRQIYTWKYFSKMKPVYDALYAPYKVKYRPWLGVQLFFRQALFLFAYFVPTPHQLFALGLCIVLYVYVLMNIQPYNSRWVNVMESTLMMIILLFTLSSLYFGNSVSASDATIVSTVVFLAVLSYAVIAAAFIKHIYDRLPGLIHKVKKLFKRKDTNSATCIENTAPEIRVESTNEQDSSVALNNPVAKDGSLRVSSSNSFSTLEVSFTEYREPLLDEGDLEVSKSYSVVISPRNSLVGRTGENSSNGAMEPPVKEPNETNL